MAEQPAKKPVQKAAPVQAKRSGMPGTQPGRLQQTNRNGLQQTNHVGSPQGTRSVGGKKMAVVGARGYRFGSRGGRRDIHTFNERERAAWQHGGWHHERHFGRDGYWWEVNGAWYWYAQPMDGPPSYVSDFEVVDDNSVEAEGPPSVPVVGGYPPELGGGIWRRRWWGTRRHTWPVGRCRRYANRPGMALPHESWCRSVRSWVETRASRSRSMRVAETVSIKGL